MKLTDAQIDQPDAGSDYNIFLDKEFHMHCDQNSVEGDNDHNTVKDASTEEYHTAISHEISDETDSDVDSIKCVYCSQSYNNFGAHRCHVTCTIEHNQLQHSSSSETLVATDVTPPDLPHRPATPSSDKTFTVPCVLCDEKYHQYDAYVVHLNKCTNNVKLHHFVCPVCHEIYTDKLIYLDHLKMIHFKSNNRFKQESIKSIESDNFADPGEDCVDFAPMLEKTRRPKAVRRQIGWSIEDIYQEIDCKKIVDEQTPTSSPIKTFFSKMGNE